MVDGAPQFTGKWWNCNDAITREMSIENVLNAQSAYMLFYLLVDS
jgi:ubiquitin C-terminal hydrolase